jgi:nucleoside 2-deoxyribosyltransferase
VITIKRSFLWTITVIALVLPWWWTAGDLLAQERSSSQSGLGAMKIYMAGPLGFSEAGRYFYYGELIPKVKALGFDVLDPWKLTDQKKVDAVLALPYGVERRDAWRKLNVEIAGNNRRAIDECNGVIAVLDGVDVDSGTAAEIGYGFAKGKPILGYRGDFRLSADNEGSKVNLQVEYFIRQSGGQIITSIEEFPDAVEKLRSLMRKQ